MKRKASYSKTPQTKRMKKSYKKPTRIVRSVVEKKYLDTTFTNTADITAGTVFNSLNLVPQGTTDVTRIGNKITIKNINLSCMANNDDLTTGAFYGSVLRVIVFVDKQCNGAAAAVTDILKNAAIMSYRNMDQVDRFQILKDKIITVPSPATNALHTSEQITVWKISLKCNVDVHFNSTAGAITEIRSNNVGVLLISDRATCNASLAGYARVKYIDY